MKHQFKILLLMLIFLITAYLIVQVLTWATREASKVDDYRMNVGTGWVSEPVLEVR